VVALEREPERFVFGSRLRVSRAASAKALLLEPGQDGPDQPALHAVGLHQDERSLHGGSLK